MTTHQAFSNQIRRVGTLGWQYGSSLIVVLIMLSVILVMGVISARLSLFGERSARNDRDRQVAFQAAEAALLDAEIDMMGPNTKSGHRVCDFDFTKAAKFIEGCGTDIKTGMCLNTSWNVVKALYSSESGTTSGNKTVEYGQFTTQTMPSGSSGLPVKLPRYTIEAVAYRGTSDVDVVADSKVKPPCPCAFLVTAMGFGTRIETQVLLQALIFKPANKPFHAACPS